MRVTEITTLRLRVPFPDPPATGFLPLEHQDLLVVNVALSNGVSGMGYLHPLLGGLKTLETCVHEILKPLALGKPLLNDDDTFAIPGIWDAMFEATYIQGRMGLTIMAMSAIDVALWDAMGRVMQQPLYELWGGSAEPIPTYGSGCFRGLGQQGMIDKARGYVEQGYGAIKMQVAHLYTPDEDVDNVYAMRAALGPSVEIMVDVNQGWDVDTAIATVARFEAANVYWIEEPVIAHDFAGYRRIAEAVRTRVVGGENHFTHIDLAPLLAIPLPFLQPDVMRGGFTDLRRTAERCAAHGVNLAPHLFPELMVHLLAAIPNPGWLEYMGWHDHLWEDPLTPSNGQLYPPRRPGHGLAFKPDVLTRYALP